MFLPKGSSDFEMFRSLAEFSRIPIVLTNQVRSQMGDESLMYSFQGMMNKLFLDRVS